MHGLVNRAIQTFISDVYGDQTWTEICRDAALGFDSFEALLIYDSALTETVLAAACRRLKRDRAPLLEDMGTYLVAQLRSGAVRRLLRFGGESFEDFLHSLDDLHDRARLALPDLDFPRLVLSQNGPLSFDLSFQWDKPGFAALALGILRAMADEYGALVLLDHVAGEGAHERITIDLLDPDFAAGREFRLGARP
ncbi:MAG: heme NO-binding domain-containing protein [Rhodobacteraceae bacterium]|nr:heme NO-binding domain-containing protein [Paracoccaceae bacterium]